MNSIKKQIFENKIKKANSIELVTITYEILLYYLENLSASNLHTYLSYADKCIDVLIESINYEIAPSKEILSIYIYCKKQIIIATAKNDDSSITEIIPIIKKFYKTYKIIEEGLPNSASSSQYVLYNNHGNLTSF